eukprot:1147430-Pelagomonas_calceolata.AAC.8
MLTCGSGKLPPGQQASIIPANAAALDFVQHCPVCPYVQGGATKACSSNGQQDLHPCSGAWLASIAQGSGCVQWLAGASCVAYTYVQHMHGINLPKVWRMAHTLHTEWLTFHSMGHTYH